MKNRILLLSLLLLVLASCRKDEDVMSEEEVVDLVETTLSEEESGIASDIAYVAAKTGSEESQWASNCTYAGDSAFTREFQGANVAYTFNYTYNWVANCDGLVPTSIDYASTRTGNYNGLRLTYNGSALNTFVVSDLLTGSEFNLNGNHDFAGSSVLTRTGNINTVEVEMDLTYVNIKVDKTTFEINSGTLNFSLEASGDNNSASYSGSVDFLGGGAATVTLNGNSFTISI